MRSDTKTYRLGEKYKSKYGSVIEILEYHDANHITCSIENNVGNTILYNQQYVNIIKGTIVSPYDITNNNIGYMGEGVYNYINDYSAYSTWNKMLIRCGNVKYKTKKPTYLNCIVCEEWCNFQNFCKWYYDNYYELFGEETNLDKDILVKGNKVYSPETCIFVPQFINSLFVKSNKTRGEYPIGVTCCGNKFRSRLNIKGKLVHIGMFDNSKEAFQSYKIAKEKYIKQVADEYKDRIPKKLYERMYTYEVEIDD